MNKTGIILTTFNKLDLTKKALKSLAENTNDYELLVVDNQSTDGTREWIQEQGIAMIEFDEWVGVSTALNAGIRHFFDKEYEGGPQYDICWIHNDMEFLQGWMDALREYLEQNPKCGRVNCQNLRDGDGGEPERPGNELPFLMRGHVLKTVGMFDERYKGACGYEDWDHNNKLLENDWTIMITPKARVIHTGMATRSGMCSPEWENHNSTLYCQKWGTHESKI